MMTQFASPITDAASRTRELPYDYVARFPLEGRVGNRVQDVINVSIEGAFVATAVGYSVLPHREVLGPAPVVPAAQRARQRVAEWGNTTTQAAADAVALGAVGAPILRFVPTVLSRLFAGAGANRPRLTAADISAFLDCMRNRCHSFDFLYSIVDSGSGRELQNEPIHNVAGLGSSDGERPFRQLARPMVFMPRSTIRIEVIEQTEDVYYENAQLYIVLQGYKALSSPGA